METVICGRRVLLPDGEIGPATLYVQNGIIEHCVAGTRAQADYEAGDLLIAPGIVDLHGDAYERQLHPRPRVGVPFEVGLLETDRQMIANGITTAFHGLTVTWEPGSRDIEAARATFDALDRVRPRLRCDTKIHLRHEVLSLDTVDECCTWIRDGRIALAAINDHRHMVHRDIASGIRRNSVSIEFDKYKELAAIMFAREAEIPATIERLTGAAREQEIPLASHDDESPEMREHFRALGCTISEFPADIATAGAARACGEDVVLGSPNILRGGSHCGRAGAAEMILAGLCTVLCSDYYYPSLLIAPFLLAARRVVSLADAWALVSSAPARAAKLDDRGTLGSGQRADILLIDDHDPIHPEVKAAFVAGAAVHASNWELAAASFS